MTTIDILARTLPSLAVIVGALLVLRHWARRGAGGSTTGMRVVTRTGLTKGAVLAVVAVGDRRLLVGASEHSVNLLAELEPELQAETAPVTTSAALPRRAKRPALPSLPSLSSLSSFRSSPQSTDRPRMAPIDRLRHLTVRRPVPSHPRRSNDVHRRT